MATVPTKQCFTDLNDVEWKITIDGEKIAVIKESTGLPVDARVVAAFEAVTGVTLTDEQKTAMEAYSGIDISEEDGSGVLKICTSGPRIVDVCWLLCKEQAESRGVTPKDFGAAMASGEVIEAAEKAFRAAVVNFTRPSRRAAMEAVWASQDSLTEEQVKQTVATTQDPEVKAKIHDAIKAHMDGAMNEVVKYLSPKKKDSPSG